MEPWLFPLFFALLWVFVGNIIGYVSGWWALAERYRCRGPFSGPRLRFLSGKLSACNYNGVLTVGADADGLYLACFFLFRCGHPPLFIPWSDITASVRKGWFFRYLVFHFAQAPGVELAAFMKVGEKIARLANRSWAVADQGPVVRWR